MELLKDKIKQDGIAVNEHILKVDSFINHQIDPELMQKRSRGGFAVGKKIIYNQNMVLGIDIFFGKCQLIIGFFGKGSNQKIISSSKNSRNKTAVLLNHIKNGG